MRNSFSIDEVRAFWDRVAPIYDSSNTSLGYVHTQRFEKTLEYGDLQQGQQVLNVWSRTGNLLPYLRRTPELNVVNREVSAAMIGIARAKYPGEEFGLTDLHSFAEFRDNSFDRIITLETLEHVPNPSVFMSELFRMLKPGGRLAMSLPPRGFEIPTVIYDALFHNHGEGPHMFLWPGQVKGLLAESGFRLVRHEPAIILPLGNDRLTRMSERAFGFLFGRTPLANFGVRHFYIAAK